MINAAISIINCDSGGKVGCLLLGGQWFDPQVMGCTCRGSRRERRVPEQRRGETVTRRDRKDQKWIFS